jgi:predicted nucleic acid-binding protein
MKYQRVYIDTNVVRDCIKRRKDCSISLLKSIRQRKIECVTSVFTLLELWNLEKEDDFFFKKLRQGVELNVIVSNRRQKDLNVVELNEVNDLLDKFFREYDFIKQVQLMPEGWQFAFDIARTTNIEPGDILHLATALGEKCDLLVTRDGSFIKEARRFLRANKYSLRVVKAEEAEIQLR